MTDMAKDQSRNLVPRGVISKDFTMIGAKWKRNAFYCIVTFLIFTLVLMRAADRFHVHTSPPDSQISSPRNNLAPNIPKRFNTGRKPPVRPTPGPGLNPLFDLKQTTENDSAMAEIYDKIKKDIFARSDSEYLTFRDYQEFMSRVKKASGIDTAPRNISTSREFREEPKCNRRRLELIKEVCKSMEDTKSVRKWTLKDVKRNRKKLNNIVVDDKHKMLFCEAPKTGCTSWKVAIALLTGNVRKSDILNKNYLAVHARAYMANVGLYYLNTLNDKAVRKKLRRYYKFMVVRHPLDRVVSAFTDKFIHRDPYFTWYETMKVDIKNKYRAEDADQEAPVSFREFVNYAANPDSIQDRHWQNYQELCNPCNIDYDYIVKVESMDHDAQYLLPKISRDPELGTLPEAHSHRGAQQARRPYKELREYFNITKQETERLMTGPYKDDLPMFGYRFDTESSRATCDKYTSEGQCC